MSTLASSSAMSTTALEYYVDVDYWVDGYAIDETPPAAPVVSQTVQTIIPSYLYWQYSDDSDLQAFVAAYNTMAQIFLNTFNQINLPVYAGDNLITGALLDWVAQGIYGFPRPILTTGVLQAEGVYNTLPYNTDPYNKLKAFGDVTQVVTTDDVFKRILTWNLYRGDGKIFSITWLKRRIQRFLTGAYGEDPGVNVTPLISVSVSGSAFTIDLTRFVTANPTSTMPAMLQEALQAGALYLPFMYTYTVTI